MMARLLVPSLLACVVVFFVATTSGQPRGAERLVRLSIGKTTSMQAGELGQPVTSYYAQATLGTPPKPFKLLIDINARELWVPHYLKLGIVYSRLNYRDGYSKKGSSTSVKEQDEVYNIEYMGCELSGKAYRDVLEFQNVSESLQAVKYEQRFLAISSASNDKFTRHEGVDGVLALSPWPISETGSDMTPVSLQRARLTGKLKFALLLDNDLATSHGGELTFGGANPTSYLGEIRYHQAVSQHLWELSLNSVMLGSHLIGDCQARARGGDRAACTALLSTARNDIAGPTKAIQSIHRLLNVAGVQDEIEFKGNSLHEIDCLRVATAPMLTFIIDGAYYVLPPTSYIRKKVEGLIFKSETCYVALLANGSDNKWELGTNFLTNYYSVFDQETHQVGLGVRK